MADAGIDEAKLEQFVMKVQGKVGKIDPGAASLGTLR